MSHWAKRYTRLAAKWPVDKNKSDSRNYRYFLEKQIDWICGLNQEPMVPHRDDVPALKSTDYTVDRHEANLRALQELTNNEHSKRWPSDQYVAGIMGFNLQQLQQANTEKGRESIGLTSSRWKSIKARFWRSS